MQPIPDLETLKTGALLLIDKSYKWTSFDALFKIKKGLKVKKIGHCGTLDPLATGLLIACTGKQTKQIMMYQKLPKVYTGIIELGATTESYDLETTPSNPLPYAHISAEEIETARKKFEGHIQQVPPIHSAIKKDGKRAYESAREGIEIVLEPRQVEISQFIITKIALPELHFEVHCSTGTYIRSLAHDFGAALNCGAYLKELRRTKIGNFSIEDAKTTDEWIDLLKPPKVTQIKNPEP